MRKTAKHRAKVCIAKKVWIGSGSLMIPVAVFIHPAFVAVMLLLTTFLRFVVIDEMP